MLWNEIFSNKRCYVNESVCTRPRNNVPFFVPVIPLKKHDKQKHDIISPFFKRCCSRCFWRLKTLLKRDNKDANWFLSLRLYILNSLIYLSYQEINKTDIGSKLFPHFLYKSWCCLQSTNAFYICCKNVMIWVSNTVLKAVP